MGLQPYCWFLPPSRCLRRLFGLGRRQWSPLAGTHRWTFVRAAASTTETPSRVCATATTGGTTGTRCSTPPARLTIAYAHVAVVSLHSPLVPLIRKWRTCMVQGLDDTINH